MVEESNDASEVEGTELPDQIPASKEPVEPVLEKAFKKEPRHADEDPQEPAD